MGPADHTERGLVSLPNTSGQNRWHHTAHLRLLQSVKPDAWCSAGFEGKLYRPGSKIQASELGARPLLLECAGPQGKWKPGKQRETLWILWRYDWDMREWIEVARARAFDWSWAVTLRDAAIRALSHPKKSDNSIDVARGHEVADELLEAVEKKLSTEHPDVRKMALAEIYERIAGRIA